MGGVLTFLMLKGLLAPLAGEACTLEMGAAEGSSQRTCSLIDQLFASINLASHEEEVVDHPRVYCCRDWYARLF
jgi:hypothetical protein